MAYSSISRRLAGAAHSTDQYLGEGSSMQRGRGFRPAFLYRSPRGRGQDCIDAWGLGGRRERGRHGEGNRMQLQPAKTNDKQESLGRGINSKASEREKGAPRERQRGPPL